MLIRLRDDAFDGLLLEGVVDCFFFLLGVVDFDVLDGIATFTLLGVVSFCFCDSASLRLSARAARRDIGNREDIYEVDRVWRTIYSIY